MYPLDKCWIKTQSSYKICPTHQFPFLELLLILLKYPFNLNLKYLVNTPNNMANTCKGHLLNVYYMLGTCIKALHVLTHLFLTTAL